MYEKNHAELRDHAEYANTEYNSLLAKFSEYKKENIRFKNKIRNHRRNVIITLIIGFIIGIIIRSLLI